ncbi:MAG TPA: hypothetical protein VF242_05740, partial [Nitrososphaeraceae archaeon]
MIMPNANGELSIIKNENNSSEFEKLNKTTITTTNATLENNIDNKTIFLQEDISQITQMDNPEVGNNNSSISFDNSTQNNNSTQNKESGPLHPEVVASQGNITIQGIKNPDFLTPIVSYIENEGSQLAPLNYENNYRGFSSNEDDNSESRDRASEIDKEINEVEEDSKDAETNEEVEEDSKDAETNEEVEEDSKDAETNEEVEEDSKDAETNEEVEED